MYLIERMSNSITQKISSVLNLGKEREEIIAYGAYNLIQTVWSILLALCVAYLLNIFFPVLVILVTSSVLRKYSGGAHALSPNRCAVIGILLFNGFGYLVDKYITNVSIFLLVAFSIACFLITYYIIYQYAPVDSPSKPIANSEFRQKLKNYSLVVIHIFLIVVLILFSIYIKFPYRYIINAVICINVGIVWQSLTLIKLGSTIIHGLDKVFKYFTQLLIGGEVE